MSNVLADSSVHSAEIRRPAMRLSQNAFRFIVAGSLASLMNWLVRFPLSAVMPFTAAVVVSYGVGMAIGFFLYRAWVFPGSTVALGAQLTRFVIVNAVGLATVVLAAKILVSIVGFGGLLSPPDAEALAHGLAIAVGAVVNFLGHRALTFARQLALA